MTLVHRVSLFFLAALAVCLIGYSAASYWLIRGHLYRQFDSDLLSSFNALVAAVEVEPEEAKWQPAEHTIAFGDEDNSDDVRWIITDGHGNIIDRSPNMQQQEPDEQALLRFATARSEEQNSLEIGHTWRYLQKRLAASTPKSDREMEPDEAAVMIITAARNIGPLQSNLQWLLFVLCVVPAVLWLLAAIVGRSFARRALAPLGEMASRAESVTTADFQLRLPVTERRDELNRLAVAFNGVLNQLQQAFENQRRFTGDAAHQLRTPLTVLRGEIEIALRKPRSSEEYTQTLAALLTQTAALQCIVESLLFLAQASNDTTVLQLERIALPVWYDAYQQHWHTHPRESDLYWEIAPQTSVRAAPELLRQALDNLIDNALKYSPGGSPVTIRIQQCADTICIAVEDRGPGVAEHDRAGIFEPFYRSTSARQSGTAGLGLGLALVSRIAQAHGGRARYEPCLPSGSRFILELPATSG